MAQFTVMRGRNIPREAYRGSEILSMVISTNWTKAAMTMMKTMYYRWARSRGFKI